MKNITKSVRLNAEEFSYIDEKIKDLDISFSEYAIKSMMNIKIKKNNTKIERDFLLELNRIGNNFNQVAKHLNINNAFDRVALEMLKKIEIHLQNLRKIVE